VEAEGRKKFCFGLKDKRLGGVFKEMVARRFADNQLTGSLLVGMLGEERKPTPRTCKRNDGNREISRCVGGSTQQGGADDAGLCGKFLVRG